MSWKIAKLSEVCSKIGSGATPKGGSTVYIEKGTALIRSQNVYNLSFDYNGLVYINDETAKKLNGVTIEENDVLINITGDSVARTCIVPAELLPARVNQHVAIVRPNGNVLNPYFLNYYLASPYMQSYMLGLAVGKGASRNAMTKDMIANFEVPCPSIEVQQNIVAILKSYDDLIENNQKQIKLLEEAAQRLYKEWFVYLRFPGYEDVKIIDGVPEGWRYGSITDISICFDKNRKPLSSIEREKHKKIYPYYGAASLMDYVEKYIFDGVYLLFGEDGTVITNDGTPMLQYVWGKFWVNNHAHVFQRKEEYSTEFLYMLCKHMKVNDVVTGVAQPKISQGRLNEKKILLPDKDLVTKYSVSTSAMFKKIRILNDEIVLCKEVRDRLLPKLMNGEIEV